MVVVVVDAAIRNPILKPAHLVSSDVTCLTKRCPQVTRRTIADKAITCQIFSPLLAVVNVIFNVVIDYDLLMPGYIFDSMYSHASNGSIPRHVCIRQARMVEAGHVQAHGSTVSRLDVVEVENLKWCGMV